MTNEIYEPWTLLVGDRVNFRMGERGSEECPNCSYTMGKMFEVVPKRIDNVMIYRIDIAHTRTICDECGEIVIEEAPYPYRFYLDYPFTSESGKDCKGFTAAAAELTPIKHEASTDAE